MKTTRMGVGGTRGRRAASRPATKAARLRVAAYQTDREG